jgi:hypothetical protein
MTHLENRNLMPLVINEINDSILALAYAIAIHIARKFFTALCAGIGAQQPDGSMIR